jgi:hypothetical protein
MSYGVNIQGREWGTSVGYEAGMAQPEGLSAEAKRKRAWQMEQEAKQANAPIGDQVWSKQADAPTKSEIERALIEQSEGIERLAGMVSAMLARLSPVLMDCPVAGAQECYPCQPYSTEVARMIGSRTATLSVLTDELRTAYERLGV